MVLCLFKCDVKSSCTSDDWPGLVSESAVFLLLNILHLQISRKAATASVSFIIAVSQPGWYQFLCIYIHIYVYGCVCVYINIFGSIYLQPNNQSDPLFRCIRAPICHHRKTAAQSCVHCNAVPSRCVEKKLYSLRAQPWTHCADMCRCSQEMSRYLNRQGVRSKQTSLARDCQYIVYTLIFRYVAIIICCLSTEVPVSSWFCLWCNCL